MNLFLYNETKMYKANWKDTVVTIYNVEGGTAKVYEKDVYSKHEFKKLIDEQALLAKMTVTTKKLF